MIYLSAESVIAKAIRDSTSRIYAYYRGNGNVKSIKLITSDGCYSLNRDILHYLLYGFRKCLLLVSIRVNLFDDSSLNIYRYQETDFFNVSSLRYRMRNDVWEGDLSETPSWLRHAFLRT